MFGRGIGRGYSVKTSLVFVFLCPCQAGECHVKVYGENCWLLLATPFLFSLSSSPRLGVFSERLKCFRTLCKYVDDSLRSGFGPSLRFFPTFVRQCWGGFRRVGREGGVGGRRARDDRKEDGL